MNITYGGRRHSKIKPLINKAPVSEPEPEIKPVRTERKVRGVKHGEKTND